MVGRVPDAQVLFPQAHKWANGAGPPGHCASQQNEACACAVRRTPSALRKLVSSGRNTYLAWEVSDGERNDLCRERENRHREALRLHLGRAAWERFSRMPVFAASIFQS
jgi:hypothetical protein